MKNYHVCIPFAGYMSVSVTADSEDWAIRKAMNIPWEMKLRVPDDCKDTCPEIEEVDVFRRVSQGNVCHAPLHEAYAEDEE